MDNIKEMFKALEPHLTEKTRRLVVAAATIGKPHGSKGEVAKATGVSYREIRRGLAELEEKPGAQKAQERIRKEGGGRKQITENDITLLDDLKQLVESTTRGDPMSPLLYTSKSLRKLAAELGGMGHNVSHSRVGTLLEGMGYRLQANRKVLEGANHPDRNEQFEYINETVKRFQADGQPAISIDCKKHENVGNYKNAGREYHTKGTAPEVKDHDFIDKELGKAIPYGVYDMTANAGFVNVGIDHDTSVFAVQSIRLWWESMGRERYPDAAELLITADGGGSNGYRRRLWKTQLAAFAKETGLAVTVCHFPTGTSKWNKIEHRLFSYITMNWRGRPLTSIEVIVSLIAATKTSAGLEVKCVLDENDYPTGTTVSDEDLNKVPIQLAGFHGEWNYTILPSPIELNSY
jgi:transposase